jgi:transcriptional regulator with XRE-family HTH domain
MSLRVIEGLRMSTTDEPERVRLRVVSSKALSEQETKRVRKRLEELVEQYGSQAEVALRTGVSQQTISNVIRGFPVGRDVAKRLAAHDRMPVEQWLGPEMPVALAVLLRENRSRWQPYTVSGVRVAAVTTVKSPDDLSTADWERMLDELDEAATKIISGIGRRRSSR